MAFTARWPSKCDTCGEQINAGDLIQGTGERTYEHVICPEDAEQKASKFEGTTLEEMGY